MLTQRKPENQIINYKLNLTCKKILICMAKYKY